ncbi:InlB B-repeat-containing protein [Methylolobus aquaticus]
MKSAFAVCLLLVSWCQYGIASESARALPPGFLDVTTVAGVYPNDPAADSTVGIRNAMNSAFQANQTLYFPANTVLYVSDTLAGVQPPSPCADPQRRSYRLWGGGRNGARPRIVLKDSAAGFGTAATPKRLLHIGKDTTGDGVIDAAGEACAFGHVIKNIDLVLGNNPGAIGIDMAVAQESVLEDVNIDATGGYAGITGVPGRSVAVGNIQITGGQYGFRVAGVGLSLYGIRLLNQTTASIWETASRSFAIVGFDIRPASGSAIQTAGTIRDAGHVGLYDGRIELPFPGIAIDNNARRIVDLRNVYLRSALSIISNGPDGSVAASPSSWSLVNTYTYSPVTVASGLTSWNLIDGLKSRNDNLSLTNDAPPPPSDLIARHLWAGSPDLLDPRVVYVTDAPFRADGTGQTDTTSALQAAIDSTEPGQSNAGKWLFVPPGTYQVTAPLLLKSHTHLFGVPFGQSSVYAADSWTGSLTDNAWVIDTVNDAAAETSIEYLLTNWASRWNTKGLRIGVLRWRVGERSVMRGMRPLTLPYQCEDQPRQIYRVEGNGGGRWYTWYEALQAAGNGVETDGDCDIALWMNPDFRKLSIVGTTQPFTIYGANPEHGGSQSTHPASPFIEITDSANVRTFGMKAETNGPILSLTRSTNVFIGSSHAYNFGTVALPYIRVDGSNNFAMTLIAAWGGSTAPLVEEIGMPPSDIVYHDAELGIYSRGSLNWSAWSARHGPKYQISAASGSNGTIVPDAVTVDQWSDQTFTIAPDPGYRVAAVEVDQTSATPTDSYTFRGVQDNHTLTASFEPIPPATATLSASTTNITNGDPATLTWSSTDATRCEAGGPWTIDPGQLSGTQSVSPSTSADYSITCTGEGGSGTAAVSIVVKPKTYTITASAGTNGSITPSGEVAVEKGKSQAFTLTPNAGYRIASVVVDGTNVGPVSSYSFASVTADHSIVASFERIPEPTVNLTASATNITDGEAATLTWSSTDATRCEAGGPWSIAPSQLTGALSVSPGTTSTYTLSCTGEGGTGTAAVTIVVGPKTYTITASAGANGSITPSGEIAVEKDKGQDFILTPNAGYRIASVIVDGADVGPVSTYSFATVTADHSIAASFDRIPEPTVTLTASATNITDGDSVTLTWSSTEATRCEAGGPWSVEPSQLTGSISVSPSTTSAFTLNCTGDGGTGTAAVTIVVAPKTYTITASAGSNGSISPSGTITVLKGASQSFTLVPRSGYRVASVIVDGVNVGALTAYSFTNVTANHSIAGTFERIPAPTVTLTANPTSIRRGQSATLSWTSTNATSCTASSGWSGSKPLSGSSLVAPRSSTTYNLSCTGSGGSRSASVRISVR